MEGKWNQIKDIYCNTAKNTLGYLRSTDKTLLSTDTWRRIEERKTIKSKILNTKSKRNQERLQIEYSIKAKAIKKSTEWRGITFLSVPSMIFYRVLLNRIEGAIDVKQRQEQAGFRRGK